MSTARIDFRADDNVVFRYVLVPREEGDVRWFEIRDSEYRATVNVHLEDASHHRFMAAALREMARKLDAAADEMPEVYPRVASRPLEQVDVL